MSSSVATISIVDAFIIRFILMMALVRYGDLTGIEMFPPTQPMLFFLLYVHTFPVPCQFQQSVSEKINQ
jgi:hypothetical protein